VCLPTSVRHLNRERVPKVVNPWLCKQNACGASLLGQLAFPFVGNVLAECQKILAVIQVAGHQFTQMNHNLIAVDLTL